jgi:hypothetical protein
MTVIRINIPDDVKEALAEVFPDEPPEAVIQRLILAEIERRKKAIMKPADSLVAIFDNLAAKFPALSVDDIRRIREDGRP